MSFRLFLKITFSSFKVSYSESSWIEDNKFYSVVLIGIKIDFTIFVCYGKQDFIPFRFLININFPVKNA